MPRLTAPLPHVIRATLEQACVRDPCGLRRSAALPAGNGLHGERLSDSREAFQGLEVLKVYVGRALDHKFLGARKEIVAALRRRVGRKTPRYPRGRRSAEKPEQ